MFELAVQMRADGGGPVFDLSLGNPSLEPPQCWRDAVSDLLVDEPPGMHRYMTNAGYPEVRAFLAGLERKRFGLEFDTSDVTMTVGAAGGLNVLLRAVADPGDEVVVPSPYFSEYDHYCANSDTKLVPIATGEDFALDVDAIVAGISPRTRLLLLNSPNNPTGAIYDDDSLRALGRELTKLSAGRERTLFVVEDSPYRDLVHDGSSVPSMLVHYDDTVHLTSHSKDLGLAGERIGYILISPRARGREPLARAAAFCNRVLGFVNAPALMQRALPRVLGRPEGRVDVGVYARKCRRMAAGLRELGFYLPDPRAGFFLFPRLPERLRGGEGGQTGDVVLTERLRQERTIVVPGTAFGVPEHLRLSVCADDDAIEGGLAALGRVCA
jgi:aspartate aminotransferase